MPPTLFFDALFSIRYFRTSRIHFHADPHGWESYGANAQPCPLTSDFDAWRETLAYASGVFASEIRCANLEHLIPVARPAQFLSFRTAHANARGRDVKKTGWAA
jgi:hypothetical protein